MNLDAITVADLEHDPYPIYAHLRGQRPVAHMPCLDVWMVTRWDDVALAATDPDSFPAHVERSPTDRALGGVSMMTTDGQPAKQRRRPFDPTFRPRSVEASMPTVFEQLCDARLDEIESAGTADLVTDYFEPISLLSLAHAMGLRDHAGVDVLRRWFHGLAAGVSNYEDDPAKTAFCDEVSAEIDDTLWPLFEAGAGGLMADLASSRDGSMRDRFEWIMPSVKLVLLGGLQEPAHGGATIAWCLLEHPEQLEAVRSDPTLVATAVEEGLRWTAPIGNLLRGVAQGAALGDVVFGSGARLILVVSSANRDRAIWGPTADEFDIHRPRRNHMSFATGPHYCIGHHFARVQLRTALRKLLDRFPRLRLDLESQTTFRGHEYRSPDQVRVVTS